MSTRIIAVDMDGTLIKKDATDYAMSTLWRQSPLKFLLLVFTRLGLGWSAFKYRVFQSVGKLPAFEFNQALLDWLTTQKQQGARLILITASPDFAATQVAQRLPDFFDDVVGSSETKTLRSHAKANYLCDQFGFAGFDYIGNSVADVAVWKRAATAYNVNPQLHIKLWCFLRGCRNVMAILP